MPAFVVFTDATLQLIAEHKPRTPEALLKISGIGRSKLERTARTSSPWSAEAGPPRNFREIPTKSFAHYMGAHDSFPS